MELVRASSVSFKYNGAKAPALSSADIRVGEGEFVLLCGGSGCGKTTLLKLIKPELSPPGEPGGSIEIFGRQAKRGEFAPEIGFVMQSPYAQSVSDTVYGELAFGLKNLGLDEAEIKRRIAETAAFFGIDKLMHRELSSLSGGELQTVCICAVMVMQPRLIILDEPVSRLDPLAAERLISMLGRINRETGTSLLVAEHLCEGLFPLCDRAYFMEKGKVVGCYERGCGSFPEGLTAYMPAAARIASQGRKTSALPLTVREGRAYLRENYKPNNAETPHKKTDSDTALEAAELYFSYDHNEVLTGCDIAVKKGEILTVVGANGSGKSTLLKCLSGGLKPHFGRLRLFGKPYRSYKNGSLYRQNIAFLPQEPTDIFTQPTVGEDYALAARALGADKELLNEITAQLGIAHLMDTHPYDLSGGEVQLCALGRLLLARPRVLLLDEPVKGLDPESIRLTGKALRGLAEGDMAVICVSHDLDFAAGYSDRCGLFSDGRLQSVCSPEELFTKNRLYTTTAARICRGIFDGAVTAESAIKIMKEQDGIG